MTTTRKYFGTDGIRGTVGDPPITPDFVMKLGWAAGRVLGKGSSQSGHRSKVLIGKDTRVSGYMFESALEAGLSAAGVDIHLLGPMPTPGIAYLTRTFRAQAGIVISASHNPFNDNGIKFFGGNGMKLADETECAIERELELAYSSICSKDLGKAHRVEDAAGRYVEFCKSTLTCGGGLAGMNIVLDCANGATYHVAPAVLTELGASVDSIGVAPNGFNINEECGAVSPEALRKRVLATGADLGIALGNLGLTYELVGDMDRALSRVEEAYILKKDVLGDGHPETVLTRYNLGSLMINAAKFADAAGHLVAAADLSLTAYGETHIYTGRFFFRAAVALQRLEQHDRAVELAERARRIYLANDNDVPASWLEDFARFDSQARTLDNVE